jgi:antitoxin CcdA
MIHQIINLRLGSEALETSNKRNADVSNVYDEDLKERAQHQYDRRWRIIHTDFIHIYNKTLESEGLPLDSWRSF